MIELLLGELDESGSVVLLLQASPTEGQAADESLDFFPFAFDEEGVGEVDLEAVDYGRLCMVLLKQIGQPMETESRCKKYLVYGLEVFFIYYSNQLPHNGAKVHVFIEKQKSDRNFRFYLIF